MWSTPQKAGARQGTARGAGEGAAPGSVDRASGVVVRSRLLLKRKREESPAGTPKKRRVPPMARKALFPAGKREGMIFMSVVKGWKPELAGKGLPPTVMVGLRVPWLAQRCRLCDTHLGTVRTAQTHMRKAHKPRMIQFICDKCASTFKTPHRAACHAAKCGAARSGAGPTTGYACDTCPKTFSSQRGLSVHERRKHLGVYVSKAREQKERETEVSGWSRAELATLESIHESLGGKTGFLEAAASALPHYTRAQIQNRWRNLRRLGRKPVDKSPTGVARDLLPNLEEELPPRAPVALVKEHLARTVRAVSVDSVPPLSSSCKAINRYLKEVLTKLRSRCHPRVVSTARKTGSDRQNRFKMNRRLRYKNLQTLYRRNRSSAARWVLDGRERAVCRIDPKLVAETYRGIWERDDCFKGLGQFASLPEADNTSLFPPISPAEALQALRRMDQASASGPDGVERNGLLMWDRKGEKLADLFNAIMYSGRLPRCLKHSRTTLIPKASDQSKAGDISNWRPITIGSVFLRAFSRVLTQRLTEACAIHPRQRGFTDAPGCSENLAILDGLIRLSKSQRKTLAVVFIDLTKAFDTVSHKHIAEVLERRGVDELIRGLIQDSYRNCYTKVKTAHGDTRKIKIRVGVKQGDPMSPLLFNLALDPLLHMLERLGTGFSVEGTTITSLAFADDLVILSDSWGGMARNLEILDRFSNLTGLTTNPAKCHGFLIGINGPKRYTVNDCDAWSLAGIPIHMVGEQESAKYLGVQINPCKGILKPLLRETIKDLTGKISKALLKPSQKVELLRTYAIPRVVYVADHGSASQTLLDECDRDIRTQVKKWLHLEPFTTDGVLYSRCADGGLGIIKMAAHIPAIQLKRMMSLYDSTDECTKTISRASLPISRVWQLWRQVLREGDRPEKTSRPDLGQIDTSRANTSAWRATAFDKWSKLVSQGVGTVVFKDDRLSNSWTRDPEKHRLKQSELIMALQLRTNTLPTLSLLSKGRGPQESQQCRLCQQEKETAQHIIGNCVELKGNRMASHNKICEFLKKEGEDLGWHVMREKRLKSGDGITGVPDLIMIRDHIALILDVTICFEKSVGTLSDADSKKVGKYEKFREAVKHLNPEIQTVLVAGFPLGARGKWHQGNFRVLDAMGMRKSRARKVATILSKRALLQTIDTCKLFKILAR